MIEKDVRLAVERRDRERWEEEGRTLDGEGDCCSIVLHRAIQGEARKTISKDPNDGGSCAQDRRSHLLLITPP